MSDPTGKPWNAKPHEAPEAVQSPRGMIGPEERRAFYWFGRHWLSGQGCLVDAGSYVGASTFCFAAGARDGGHTSFRDRPVVHAYDYFKVVDRYVGEAIRRDFRPIEEGESYLDIFQGQTAEFAELIQAYPGDFLSHRWHGDPIEVLFIDIAKTQALNCHVVGEFFPSLIPGRSVIIHQDYHHCWHPYIHITMEFFKDELELIDEYVPHQSRVWRLAKPLPADKIARVRDYDLDAEERMALLDDLVASSSAASRPMMEVVRMWQRAIDRNHDGVYADLARLREDYGLDDSGALWAKQALHAEAHVAQRIQRRSRA